MVIAKDKLMHFGGGIVLAAFGATLTYLPPIEAGLALAAAVGIGKEVWDKLTGRGTPEVMDAVATFAGGVLLVALLGAFTYSA